jgi:ribosome-binding factor A
MANPRRRARLSSLIEQVVSELLQRRIKDPRVHGVVSITRVEVSPDISRARIFVSVMGTEDGRRATMRALEHASGFVRSRLGDELTIRHVPEVQFVLDRSIEQGDHVLAILNKLDIPPPPTEEPAIRTAEHDDGRRTADGGG